MKPDAFREHVLGALPAEGFTLTPAKVQALIDALKKLDVRYDETVMKAVVDLAAVLDREQETTAPARALLRSLIDKVEMGQQTSLSLMRFAKF